MTKFWMAAVAAAVAAGPAPAMAAAYSAEYVFGDSLSDRGNLAELIQPPGVNFPSPPSNHDSFTNGPVAVQLLAQSYGLNANPSLFVTGFTDPKGLQGGAAVVPGTNYAVAGATAAAQPLVAGGIPGANLPQQVAAYGLAAGGMADPAALYVVMTGGNDVRNAALQGTGTAAVITGVQTELAAVQTLAAEGAKKFLVVNVPNVGIIPEFAQDHPAVAANATLYSQQYDLALASGLASLALPSGTSLTQFDLYSYNSGIIANAAAYGLTDLTDRCYTSTPLSAATSAQCGANAANINQFVYWDAIHPTGKVQALWATGFETALGVPEPSSVLLLGVMLFTLAGFAKWRTGLTRAVPSRVGPL